MKVTASEHPRNQHFPKASGTFPLPIFFLKSGIIKVFLLLVPGISLQHVVSLHPTHTFVFLYENLF